MAQVFHRSSGRAWRLRQRSLALWEQWCPELQALGHPVNLRRGLLLLAASSEEAQRQQRLCAERQAQGLALELWSRERLQALQPSLPAQALGALWSPRDGQLDPGPTLEALLAAARGLGATTYNGRATELRRAAGGWRVQLASGQELESNWLVICAGVPSAALLAGLGHSIALAPVLGQALELAGGPSNPWHWSDDWPAAVTWRGINLVPRRAQPGDSSHRLWLGATLEPGSTADPAALQALQTLQGDAPSWLQQAQVLRQWQGLRAQPQGRPAPWLEQLEPGLLLASGHYRNGLLLAPATAEWLAQQLEAA